ncbi:MAG TPA: sterol desaturase family protein [Terriglobia bacterium]|jgi:sterol desaturase/sphingolipid hydroxylase (fatty acid hydroxylase superfamily)
MTLKERLYRFRSFWIFPIAAVVLLRFAVLAEPQRSSGDLVLLFLLGVFLWTFLEYVLHRFLFHIQIPIKNPQLHEIINGSHLLHHASPRDPTKILVHPAYGLVVSTLIYGLLYAVFLNAAAAAVVLTGIWAGFLYYEAVHYRVHFSLSGSGLVARQRKPHFYHHFTTNKRCFGVTTPLWDYVFGTTARRAATK